MKLTIEEIRHKLIEEGIVKSKHASNTTIGYAMRWAAGEVFDFSKSAVCVQRARLRKIGLDIKDEYTGQIEGIAVDELQAKHRHIFNIRVITK